MSGRHHRAGGFGVAPHFVADGEEAGAGPKAGEHVENFRGVLRIGPVIDGQPDFTLAGAERPEDGAVPRTVWNEGGT